MSSLQLIDKIEITSGVSSLTIGGGSSGSSGLNAVIDSTYSVYILQSNGIKMDTDTGLFYRVTNGGSARTGSNYTWVNREIQNNGGSINENRNFSTTNTNIVTQFTNIGIGTGHSRNQTMYLFHFGTASYPSTTVCTSTMFDNQNRNNLLTHSGKYNISELNDGIQINTASGNMTDGQFLLYGIAK